MTDHCRDRHTDHRADHGIGLPEARRHVVPAVAALANEPWQREVWLDESEFETLGYVVHVLFEDFCDADAPEPYLGASLRTYGEVALMRRLGAAYGAVQDSVGARAPDEAYLEAPGWAEVVRIAGRLAQVMVEGDLAVLARLGA